jgi:hypothetical protein
VAPAEITTGEKTLPVGETVDSENPALAPPPLNSSYNGGSSSDYRNSGPNRANDRNGNAFANNASDRRQSHFSGEQHQDRRTDPVKLAMAMRARSSSKDLRFQVSGGPNENILDYIQEYKPAICEYVLSSSMQKDFFYRLFRTSSDPLSFYRNKANDVFSFDDAVNIMVKRYNTPERQARVHTYLTSLRFTSFRFDEKLDASSTLTALTSEISKLSPMGPPQYQGEVHAVEHLRNAVPGETWANDVRRAMNPQTISFSDFGTNLHRAPLLRDELNAIASTYNLGHGGSSGRYRRASPANTLYQNQVTYGKPRTPGSTSSVPKGGPDSAENRIGANGSVATDAVAPAITRSAKVRAIC